MNRMLTLVAATSFALSATAAIGQTTMPAPNGGDVVQPGSGQATADQQNADAQAAYQSDLAAYEQALRDNHRSARQDQQHYDHQRRAYADAMAAWRAQVYACHHGSGRACNAPTPNPADFW